MMDDIHKKCLRQNRTALIGNIADPTEVVEMLYEKGIFTEMMKQEVEAEKVPNNQVRKILDILPKRGPQAFSAFCSALQESSNVDALNLLQPGSGYTGPREGGGEVGYAIPKRETTLPPDWPNEAAMTTPVNVQHCSVHTDLVKNYWLSGDVHRIKKKHQGQYECLIVDVYPMRKKHRGRCLIIGNKVFTGPVSTLDGVERVELATRFGTDKDEEDLQNLFSQLHFVVAAKKNLTAEAIHSVLQTEARHPDHANADCFVCVICSHGTHEGIYGTDGKTISLSELTSYFDNSQCKALSGKPKLFFIQACQGENVDEVRFPSCNSGGQDMTDLVKDMQNLTVNSNQPDARREGGIPSAGTSIPSKMDMLVACATHPGFVSLRNQVYGSWFIQAVVYVFQRYAKERDITNLLTLVNNLVGKGRSETGGSGMMQASKYESSLSKMFYFFPGVAERS